MFKAKQPQILNFRCLTFKTRHWGVFLKNPALYLTVPLCCSKIALSQDLGVVYYCFLLKWVDEYGNEKRQKRCDIWVHLSTAVHWIAQSHSLTLKMVSIPHWQIFMKLLPLKERAILIIRWYLQGLNLEILLWITMVEGANPVAHIEGHHSGRDIVLVTAFPLKSLYIIAFPDFFDVWPSSKKQQKTGENVENIKFSWESQLNFMFSTCSPSFVVYPLEGLRFLAILVYCVAPLFHIGFMQGFQNWKIIPVTFTKIYCK